MIVSVGVDAASPAEASGEGWGDSETAGDGAGVSEGVGLGVGLSSGVVDGGGAGDPETVGEGVGEGSGVFIEKNVLASLTAKAVQLNSMSNGAGLFKITAKLLVLTSVST